MLAQILMEKTKMMPGRIMVLYVCSGVVLSALGLYEPILKYAKAGASIPLTGFGHVLWQGMKESISKDGLLGVFSGGFTACAAGVCAALVFSYIASFFFKSKMKK